MGSSKGYDQGVPHYMGTIACVISRGPLYGLQAILLNGEAVWTGPVLRGSSTGPLTISTAHGTLRIYWGTDDQPADPTLNQYAYHPPYPGVAYCVFINFDHGAATNAYNAEFICLAAPAQSLVTGTPASASLDECRTCNAAVFAAEVITSESWLGRAASELDQPSFQALANALQAEQITGAPAGRSLAAVSPLVTDATETRALLSDLLTPLGAWLRVTAAGLVQAGRWVRDAEALTGVMELTLDDLTEPPVVNFEDQEDAPNSVAVEFTDSEALHKGATLSVDDAGAIAEAGVLRRTTVKRPWLITADQAIRSGLDELARVGRVVSWSGSVRYPRALKPSGDLVQPGDYLSVPLGLPGTEDAAILRVLKVRRPKDATSAVEIEGELDPGARVLETAAAAESADPGTPDVVPPVMWSRLLALPPLDPISAPPVIALAARPHSLALGLEVAYDSGAGGDFPTVARQSGFALPVRLAASFGSGSSTVRVRLLDPVDGADPRRDEQYLRAWAGGATEGRNDELLLILLKKDEAGDILRHGDEDSLEYLEVLSIASAPALVSTDTFQASVLRGRLGTAALAFTDGPFPASWEEVEGWVIPRYLMARLAHNDFAGMLATGTPGWFRLGAYTARKGYAPVAAWEERQRRTAAAQSLAELALQPDATTYVPQAAYAIPAGLNTAPRVEWISPASFPATASGGDLAVHLRWLDGTGNLSEVLLTIIKSDGTGYAEVLRQSLSPRATHEWSGTVNFPSTGTWTLSAVGTDSTGQTGRSDQTVTR
ncbi:hypothetical protein H5P28_00365 [Ruficoccus amylovorans]|uniref:Tip attachment protein J domain-containing protein n=1 Tax=Ruficoccus amylovorans TaxID=1804625 RepID=A0A842H904_9BACT|nr:hypothetical protein [Ruficoccus amylovorans]MBC2592705.1 hypothetical protein [Ruficoccus amylovorans]